MLLPLLSVHRSRTLSGDIGGCQRHAVRGPEKQMTTASETQATMTHNAELEGDPRAPAFNWHTLQANHSTERHSGGKDNAGWF